MTLSTGEISFTPLPADKCPECKKIRSSWYDERNRHMAEEFMAGTQVWELAKGYRLSNERVVEVVIHELGLMAYQRQSRIQRHNAIMEREEEE